MSTICTAIVDRALFSPKRKGGEAAGRTWVGLEEKGGEGGREREFFRLNNSKHTVTPAIADRSQGFLSFFIFLNFSFLSFFSFVNTFFHFSLFLKHVFSCFQFYHFSFFSLFFYSFFFEFFSFCFVFVCFPFSPLGTLPETSLFPTTILILRHDSG